MKTTARVPFHPPGEAEEVAAAAQYFDSDESRFTAGAERCIDGGLTFLYASPQNFKLNRME